MVFLYILQSCSVFADADLIRSLNSNTFHLESLEFFVTCFLHGLLSSFANMENTCTLSSLLISKCPFVRAVPYVFLPGSVALTESSPLRVE